MAKPGSGCGRAARGWHIIIRARIARCLAAMGGDKDVNGIPELQTGAASPGPRGRGRRVRDGPIALVVEGGRSPGTKSHACIRLSSHWMGMGINTTLRFMASLRACGTASTSAGDEGGRVDRSRARGPLRRAGRQTGLPALLQCDDVSAVLGSLQTLQGQMLRNSEPRLASRSTAG